MAFTPVTKEKKINGVTFKAQFNGCMAAAQGMEIAKESTTDFIEYLFEHVIIEPKIDDVDDFFGTDIDMLNDVVEFAGKVMNADKKYFPKSNKGTAKEKSKE